MGDMFKSFVLFCVIAVVLSYGAFALTLLGAAASIAVGAWVPSGAIAGLWGASFVLALYTLPLQLLGVIAATPWVMRAARRAWRARLARKRADVAGASEL
ncbi:MAG: hypothetical protein AAF735_01195 [Myxococcota bacterium]